ncbi:hypothetical protein GLOIN_2v1486226 [Rhizophagus irregularis DAOM 181602=DAOM 197198]|uniref:Uncharacterized protein n=1 Tax=Rhizophagus irregularis (strain DAOM 181602 / DAOM 197198 / MUCL 43194) TaxID=747089 RepID=A0A2P4P7Z8_RHIID|nr:hypothetical protein GLOIN_2v1486226 [Rhizophagus irregularis DAOM 181602=DAOM 197198]POG61477.1 hypothetical protein GLOIN_2v1486226 [Rhizophagus irregularis DAOM 181602=DAOM 197198]|eukprot:XP_025168343.1 hypothetical protein GLOIN_2v1486226 [Rhizophagus irregularis DAOM 181602=DAOM 197198]
MLAYRIYFWVKKGQSQKHYMLDVALVPCDFFCRNFQSSFEGTRAFDGSDSDSGSDSRPKGDRKRKKSKNQQPNPTTSKRYQLMSELRKNMREALQKRRNRSKTIVNLKELKDPLIEKFKDEELLPIVSDNGYHSPEFSEDDDGQNIIVVRNLRWRSSTLRRFLYYVDKNTKKGIKKREQVYKPSESVDEIAPSDAPGWAKSGYDGPLKRPVAKVVSKYITQ